MVLTKENVLIISSTNRLGQSEESFRQSISQTPGILNASITTSIPSGSAFGDSYVPEPEGVEETVKEINLSSFMVDESFIPTLGIKIVAGQKFFQRIFRFCFGYHKPGSTETDWLEEPTWEMAGLSGWR